MIHLFFIDYGYSGAQTYSRQLLESIKLNREIAFYEICFNNCIDELEIEDTGLLMASGIGWKINYPGQLQLTRHSDVVPYYYVLLEFLKNIDGKIIFHCNCDSHIYIAEFVRRYFDIRIISTIHFLPKHYYWRELNGYVETLTETKNEGYVRTLDISDRLICVTQFAAKSIPICDNVSPSKCNVIYNGYSSHNTVKGNSLRDRFSISPDDLIILFVGRLSPEKGVVSLISAFKDIRKANNKVKLFLVGDDSHSIVGRLIVGYEDCITVTGNQNAGFVSEMYDICTIGVIPSKYEQCSYVALEMMSHGVAIVATATPGLQELFTDDQSGLLVDVSSGYSNDMLLDIIIDEDHLKHQIERLIQDNALRERLYYNSRARWNELFTSRRMADKTYELYESV